MKRLQIVVLAGIALLLSACQTTTGPSQGVHKTWGYPTTPAPEPAPESTPAPLPEAGAPITEAPPPVPVPIQPTTPELPQQPRTAEEISGSAVTSLIKQARQLQDAGKNDQAAAVLERALRIEPRNYFTWAMLANVNLAQGNYDQAESLAERSNSLSRGNVYVGLQNWKTIAAARQAQADAVGALEAQQHVDDLTRTISGGSTP